jgi:hypothetical protein
MFWSVATEAPMRGWEARWKKYAPRVSPPKTPIGPGKRVGSQPASSRACQQASRKMRCCGSMRSASSGVKWKKPASKLSMSSSTPLAGT